MRPARLATWAAIALAVVSAITPMTAHAHAELASSAPAAGATLTVAPEAVTLVFDGELEPDGTGFTVTESGGDVVGEGELDLTIAERNQVSGSVLISEPGTYAVAWTAVSVDGHDESGGFTFTYAAGAPNTAALPGGPDGATTSGAILVLVAAGIGLQRARRTVS